MEKQRKTLNGFVEKLDLGLSLQPLVYQFGGQIFAAICKALKSGYWSENMSNNGFHFLVNVIELEFQLKTFFMCHFFVQK